MSNKSVEIEILLRESIKEGLKKAKESFGDLESGSKLAAAALKKNMDENRQLIRETTLDIKRLTLALSETTNSAKKVEIAGELKSARAALLELQGQNVDMQRKQMEASAGDEKSQGSLIASLGKWALGLASVTAALEIGKSVIASTKDTADKFEFAVSAAKAGVEQLWRSLATGDFSNFLDNMGKAIQAGYDFAEAMDKVKESTWAMEMEEADVQLKKFMMLEGVRNKQLTKDQRIAIGEDYIKLEDDLAKKRVDNATLELNAYKKKAAEISGLQEQEIVNTLKQVDETTRAKAEAYNEAMEFKNSRRTNKTAEEYAKYMPLINNATDPVIAYANALKGVGTLKEDFIEGFVQAYKKVGNAEASGVQNSLRARTALNGLKADFKKDEQDAIKKAGEDAELDNRIKATRELMKNASGVELANLALKLVALEKEKKLRDDIARQAIALATDPKLAGATGALVEMSAKGGATPVTSKLATKIDKKQSENDLVDTTKKFIKEKKKQGDVLSDEELKRLKEEHKIRLKIVDAVMTLTYRLAEQLGMTEEEAKVVGGVMDTVMKAASGDYIGAAVSALSTVISLIPTHADKFKAQIEEINGLLEQQQRLIQKASRMGGESASREDELKILEDKKKVLKAEEERLIKIRNSGWDIFTFGGNAKKIQKVNDELAQLQIQIEDSKAALTDFIAGGVTENTLADSIAQAFQDGKGSVDDFGTYTNKILQDAILTVFKANILGDTLTNAQKQIATAFEDKTLTAEEIAAIRATMQTATDEAKAKMDALTGAFPEMFEGDKAQAKGMTADIKSITEETASALGGNITAIRINMARIIEGGNTSMNMLQQSLEYQQRTADNTDEMSKTLGSIDKRLSAFELDGIKVK
jgi:hypothetical protein